MDTNEELLEFPCEFHIKAIGHTTKDLDATVVSVVCVCVTYNSLNHGEDDQQNKFCGMLCEE
jgi:putative lipoic acid-binding regulatory protein